MATAPRSSARDRNAELDSREFDRSIGTAGACDSFTPAARGEASKRDSAPGKPIIEDRTAMDGSLASCRRKMFSTAKVGGNIWNTGQHAPRAFGSVVRVFAAKLCPCTRALSRLQDSSARSRDEM